MTREKDGPNRGTRGLLQFGWEPTGGGTTPYGVNNKQNHTSCEFRLLYASGEMSKFMLEFEAMKCLISNVEVEEIHKDRSTAVLM
jgi:hypothetical protein